VTTSTNSIQTLTAHRWDTAVTKHLLAADASYVACLNPKCGIYFSAEDCGSKHKAPSSNSKSKSKQKDTNIDKAACPHCEHELCLSCNRPWHSGSCDSVKKREDKQSEKAIKKLGAKPCPKCGVNIEKQGGCDHMNCKSSHPSGHFLWKSTDHRQANAAATTFAGSVWASTTVTATIMQSIARTGVP
jgi:hypothetical protein